MGDLNLYVATFVRVAQLISDDTKCLLRQLNSTVM